MITPQRCSVRFYCRANGRKSYVSSTLTSRHDSATSVCCVHRDFVEMHHNECELLRLLCVPICDYVTVLEARDSLERFMHAAGKFINCSNKHSYLRDDFIYQLQAFIECTVLYEQVTKDKKFNPPECWLVGAHYLLNKYRRRYVIEETNQIR